MPSSANQLTQHRRFASYGKTKGGWDVSFGFSIEAWGKRALFTRPELSVERVTYDVITPSAARGLIESVYWHP